MGDCDCDCDWSNLPCEIVEEIILQIDYPEDVLRFSRACRAWLTAFMRIRRKWTPANPWLLLPENTHDNPECVRKAYNPGNNKCYRLKLPETFGKNCWGSSLGWIVTFGLDLKITLFNPLTKLRLHLPSIDTMMPENIEHANPRPLDLLEGRQFCNNDCECYLYWMRDFYITSAHVFRTNDEDDEDEEEENNDGLFVAVVHRHRRVGGPEGTYLSIARPGDTTWTLIETHQDIYIASVLFWKDLLWVKDFECSLWYVDLSKGEASFKAMEFSLKPQLFVDNTHCTASCLPYLVESLDHELLMVVRTGKANKHAIAADGHAVVGSCPVHDPLFLYRATRSAFTTRFWTYKLNLSRKIWEIVATLDLDEAAMFLGKGTPLVVATPKVGTCKSKCIYFAGNASARSGHDMGIYDLDCNKIQTFYDGDDTGPEFCNPFWFTPLLY